MEPEKPFACTIPDCLMTFTNEDHLHVHTRKHDMVLQFGTEQKAVFVADQTPTPTRFIRNCEEVGLFQDLQNVNPFDEGFKRAMEAKHGALSLETLSEDVLNTPHLSFPLDADCTLYTANNQRNITISRSSSDESGAVKEYETTTISKLTNEVTRISRLVKDTETDKKDIVSYTNNVIIQEIRKDGIVNKSQEKKDINGEKGDVEGRKGDIDCGNDEMVARKEDSDGRTGIDEKQGEIDGKKAEVDGRIAEVDGRKTELDGRKGEIPPIMSQQSLDFVVDSLTGEVEKNIENRSDFNEVSENLEVIVKLPSGKRVKMKAVDDGEKTGNAKEKLRNALQNKMKPAPVNLIPCGTLIPVTIRPKIPIVTNLVLPQVNERANDTRVNLSGRCVNISRKSVNLSEKVKKPQDLLEERRLSSSAASKRYRDRLKQRKQQEFLEMQSEIQKLRDVNLELNNQVDLYEQLINRHLKKCPDSDDLKKVQQEMEILQRLRNSQKK